VLTLIIQKNLKRKDIEQIVSKLKKLGLKETSEKHEALIHRFDSKEGIIKIYKKSKKESYVVVISGSSSFEEKINMILFSEGEKAPSNEKIEIRIGIDESGVHGSNNFVVTGTSYDLFNLVDSKKLANSTLEKLFIDAFRNSEFTAIFKFNRNLLNYIRYKGYTINDIIESISRTLFELFKGLGITAEILIDGSAKKDSDLPSNIKYIGKGGELRDRNIAASGVISTFLRKFLG